MEDNKMTQKNKFSDIECEEKQWKSIYALGGFTTIIALSGLLLDVGIGSVTGGDLTSLPQTAVDRFGQFNSNKFMGLYNLDLLNAIIQVVLIPSYFALYAVHRNINKGYGLLALIIYLFGSAIMVANNTVLPMLELSSDYYSTAIESQKAFYASAGESMLARGAHGSPGIFPGFFIPVIAGLIISIVMLKGRVFSKINSWAGIIGSILMMLYVILVNFVPGVENMATAFAIPGGLLLMAWMIMFSIKLFRLNKDSRDK